MTRRPTDDEYQAYDGMHCKVIWKQLLDSWRCPVCSRTKREILIWGKRMGSNANRYGDVGFKAAIHQHHDHGDGRFLATHICGACNRLDATIKKKIGIQKVFSFSPEELRRCLINVIPNEGIKSSYIDFDTAKKIYEDFSKSSGFRFWDD